MRRINDITVPYVTAAFEPYDPFCTYDGKNLDLEFEADYPLVLKSYRVKDSAELAELALIPAEHPPERSLKSIGKWLAAKKPAPIPGPFFEWRFPMHILWFMMLPVLVPLVLVAVPTRFALSSRSSHARVKLLEGDDESMGKRLIGAWKSLESGIEDVVEEMVEDSMPASFSASHTQEPEQPNASALSALASAPEPKPKRCGIKNDDGTPALPKSQPQLTPAQHRMIANLNSLPNMKKTFAFIHPTRNSHAIIVCRSPTRVSEHRKGEGLLRFWAAAMVL